MDSLYVPGQVPLACIVLGADWPTEVAGKGPHRTSAGFEKKKLTQPQDPCELAWIQ
jgi:hypothetical protein